MRDFLRIVLLSGASWVLTPALAHGQPAPAQSQAEQLFREGREAHSRGDYKDALLLLRRSNALEPGRGKLLNIALCEEKLDQFASALRHFRELLPQLAEDDARLLIVRRHIAELNPRVAKLRIVLAKAAPLGTVVVFDTVELQPTMLDNAMTVDPGRHVILVKAPGLADRSYEVTLGEGSQDTIEVDAVSTRKTRPLASTTNGKRIAGFVVGGIGIAGIAAGTATGVVAFGTRAADEDRCSDGGWECNPEVLDRIDRKKSFAIASAVAFTSGALGVGVGALLLLSSREPRNASQVAVIFDPNGGRVMFRGSF